MSETTESTENGTATTEASKVSILDTIHKRWVDAGSKDPSAKQTKVLLDTYRAKLKETQAAQEALDAAAAAADAAAAAIVEAHGRDIGVNLDGVEHVPACYGPKVYFKKVPGATRKQLGST